MKKIISVAFILFFLISCYLGQQVPIEFRKGLRGYTGEKTTISSLININGYYETKINSVQFKSVGFSKPLERIDTFYYSYSVFFEDGIFLNNFSLQSINEPHTSGFYKYSCWGRYTITDDTIKTKYASIYPPFNGPPFAREKWYIVIDRNTVKWILTKPIRDVSYEEMAYYLKNSATEEVHPSIFVSCDTLPNPDYCWLKKEKWFWSKEEDWKVFMDNFGK